MRKVIFLLAVVVCSAVGVFAQNGEITQGTLVAFTQNGKSIGSCPLKTTEVKAEISGFLARVKVTQEFENNFNLPIEAVYKFPLSENSAVDDMTMIIGDRRIRAEIMKRGEAREIYEDAKNQGKTASLLDQERPNIFTQQVANILPNEKITVEISYVETLKFEDGEYEFVFPMTVGERYIPASMSVGEASRVTPNIIKSRTGHDISIEMKIDAGVPIEKVRSKSHLIETLNFNANNASVRLQNEKVIPNKDFVLRYDVTGGKIEDAVLMHRDKRGGFFTLILSPPERFTTEDITPKEIVFLLDVSGSMSGFPIEKAKEAMRLSLEGLNPQDSFNLITFASVTQMLFEKPVPATATNMAKAKSFLASLSGGGGTEMMTAIKAALTPSDSQKHIRIVCFMTDGYVGNDMEIIGEVQKHPNARVFAFGIGNGVNRFLLDKVAEAGLGEVEYVSLQDDGEKAAKRFYERVRTPLLTDVSVDWNGLPVADVYPKRIPDLFSAKPVIIHGRYLKSGNKVIRLKGNVAGQKLVREININFPESESENDVLATLWARTKIDDLMSKDWEGIQNGNAQKEVEEEITQLGLDYRLMTQFTSFVAVEDRIRTQGGQSVKVIVPTENPEDVRNSDGGGGVVAKTPLRTQIIQSISESPAVPPKVNTEGADFKARRESVLTKQGDRNVIAPGATTGTTTRVSNGGGNAVVISPTPKPVAVNKRLDPPPPPKPTSKTISGGVVNGKAVNLPTPAFPSSASAVGARGSVSVQVLIDENGNVVSATPVSGHPLLKSAAAAAAQNSKFAPTTLSGQPVKVSGIITYVFGNGQVSLAPSLTINGREIEPPVSPEINRKLLLQEKLHPQILAIVEALKNPNSQLPENNFVKDGSAEIEVWLVEITPEVRNKLKERGFEVIEEKQQMFIVGKVTVENLEKLVEIEEVEYIMPNLN